MTIGKIVLESNSIGSSSYLIGNPQITFFKKVYRRHTNFFKQIREIDRTFGNLNNNSSTVLDFPIINVSDLLGKMFFEVKISSTATDFNQFTVDHFGNSLIKNIKFIIGDTIIEEHTSQWLQVSRELSSKKNEKIVDYDSISSGPKGGKSIPDFDPGIGFGRKYWNYDLNKINLNDRAVGDCPLVFAGAHNNDGIELNYNSGATSLNQKRTKKIYIPLKFTFNRYPGMALPLVSIFNTANNTNVKITVEVENIEKLKGNLNSITIDEFKLYGEFIELETTERNLFKNNYHQYLIEKVSNIEINSTTVRTDNSNEITISQEINALKGPVKYMCWCISNEGETGNNKGQGPNYFVSLCSNSQHGNDGNDGNVKISFNSNNIIDMPMSYFTRILPQNYCECQIPNLDRIGMYSFSINPFDIEPSGTCDFSGIDKKKLDLTLGNIYFDNIYKKNGTISFNNNKLYIFIVTYNILEINNGIVGLKFDYN